MAGRTNDHKATPWVIGDFETGGTDHQKHGITEIALLAIKGDTLEEIGRYESLIAPYEGVEYDPIAFEKTGLSLAKLEKEGKPLEVVANEVYKFLDECNVHRSTTQYKPVLVAHNAAFENACFQQLFGRTKMLKELQKVLQCDIDFYGNVTLKTVDTLQLGRWIYGANVRQKAFTLEAMCERAGLSLADGHRAMNDVIPTTEFVRFLIKALRSGEGRTEEVGDERSFRDSFKYEF